MLTRDVRLEGFTTADWVRLAELVRPPPGHPREQPLVPEQEGDAVPARNRGGVIAISNGNSLRKLLGTWQGRLDLASQPWPVSLEELAAAHHARWALVLHAGALEDLMDRFGDRLRPEHDMLAQSLLLVGLVRELATEGAIQVWPWHPASWPVPHEKVLLRAFEAFCPDGKVLLVGAFDHGDLATCLAARRRGTGFDLIVGPDDLRRDMGLVSGDWRRDYRHLARAVERGIGPLAIGCFGELSTFRRLAARPGPGSWAAAVAARDIVLSPVVPAVAVPLGVDVGRAALATARDLADRLGATSFFAESPIFGPALERMREIAPGRGEIERLLGFDPLVLLQRLLGRRE